MSLLSRREFLLAASALATAGADSVAGMLNNPRSAIDASGFASRSAAADIRFGYAAITWGGNDVQAIKDISEAGYRGIQLRSNVIKEFGDKPAALRELLANNRLQMVALSSGGVGIAPGTEADEVAKHVRNAKFLHDVGGLYLQVTDSARPKGRKPEPDEYKRLGTVLTEIGKRTVDFGIPVGYHNHMNSLGEGPDEVDRIMDAADARYVKMELDVAHYFQGGGDPVKAVRKYKGRHLFFHIKDVESPVPAGAGEPARAYRFVELGRGKVDLPGVFAALKSIAFQGWCVVEFDSVYDKARSPKESALISKSFIEQKLKLKV